MERSRRAGSWQLQGRSLRFKSSPLREVACRGRRLRLCAQAEQRMGENDAGSAENEPSIERLHAYARPSKDGNLVETRPVPGVICSRSEGFSFEAQ